MGMGDQRSLKLLRALQSSLSSGPASKRKRRGESDYAKKEKEEVGALGYTFRVRPQTRPKWNLMVAQPVGTALRKGWGFREGTVHLR